MDSDGLNVAIRITAGISGGPGSFEHIRAIAIDLFFVEFEDWFLVAVVVGGKFSSFGDRVALDGRICRYAG